VTKRADPDNGLRKLFHSKLPKFHWQAMELGVLGTGCPDSNFCLDGVDGWIEFKYTEDYSVGLRPEQVGWISRRMRSGGRVFVITQRKHDGGPKKGPPCNELWIHEGWDAASLKAHGLLMSPPVYCAFDGDWDWEKIRSVLTDWVMTRRDEPQF